MEKFYWKQLPQLSSTIAAFTNKILKVTNLNMDSCLGKLSLIEHILCVEKSEIQDGCVT